MGVLCLMAWACTSGSRDNVATRSQTTDSESETTHPTDELDRTVAGPVGAGSDGRDAGATDDRTSGATANADGSQRDASVADPATTDRQPTDDDEGTGHPPSDDQGDAGVQRPRPDAGRPRFERPPSEDCAGVEFVDPERACSDLAGLSLSNPSLVTDADGEWNPGDTATLHVDLVAAPRNTAYISPGIVAVFDSASSAFASAPWSSWEIFGLKGGSSHTHRLELMLSKDAPVGARLYLHLEPATSSGDTTECDCPDLELEGLTLEFEVQ